MSTVDKPTPSLLSKTASPIDTEADGSPIIVDMGKKSRKDIRKLRKGKPGKLLRRVEETITHLRDSGAIAADVQPIVIVVRQRPSGSRRSIAKLWGIG